MRVGLDRLKVPWTHDAEPADTLATGGDTLLLRVGMVRRRTAHTLVVYATVTIYKQPISFQQYPQRGWLISKTVELLLFKPCS